MKVGIDASNLNGGAFHHLLEILRHGDPRQHGIEQVVVWGNTQKLSRLPDYSWLTKAPQPLLNKSLVHRIYWTFFRLKQLASNCDVLFIPGANYSTFHPQVAMCHNLLPFDPAEKRRYGLAKERIRLEVLRLLHGRVFRQADGVIFVSDYSKQRVERSLGYTFADATVIYHGCSPRFASGKQSQNENTSTLKLLYVSSIDEYKHQDKLVEAVFRLLQKGYHLELTLVGRVFSEGMLRRVTHLCEQFAQYPAAVTYVGETPYESLQAYYQSSDIFVYPSTCETFGLTLLEAMCCGLPIACSNRSSLPEIVGSAAIFFDDSVEEIVVALEKVIASPSLRKSLSQNALREAQRFSWPACAASTWAYIAQIHRRFSK